LKNYQIKSTGAKKGSSLESVKSGFGGFNLGRDSELSFSENRRFYSVSMEFPGHHNWQAGITQKHLRFPMVGLVG